jgi:uncharacterized protein
MRFAQDTQGTSNVIRRYGESDLWVGDTRHVSSVIITANAIVPWQATRVDDLKPTDLDPILALDPELILLATGREQRFPPPPVLYHALTRHVGIEVMNLGGACRTYNVLIGDGRRVALAALFG